MEKELKLAICKAVLCSPESLTQPEIEACEDCFVTQKIERAFRDAGWLPPGQSFPLTRKEIEQAFLSAVKVEEEEPATSIKDLVCTWFCSSERCECDTKTCRIYLKLINPLLALDRKQGKPDWEKMPKIGQPKRWSWVQGEKVREACIAYAESVCRKCRGEK